jgi:hypothetical protein
MGGPPCAGAVGAWKVNNKIIDVLLHEDRTGDDGVMVNRREQRAGEKIGQSNVLWGRRQNKIGGYALGEKSSDE